MIGRLFFASALLFVSSVSKGEEGLPPYERLEPEGRLETASLSEASGLAASPTDTGLMWLVNDGGSGPELFLAGTDGTHRGKVTLGGAVNTDWEDLASFVLKGKPYLLIADTGDNASKREECVLYIVEEPALPAAGKLLQGTLGPAWTIRFRYEDGPRDCEAVAVDEKAEKILLLSKRTDPPMLYELPLKSRGDGVQAANKIGQFSKALRAGMPPIPFGSQPTGMDLRPDGTAAAVVTYFGAFIFPRKKGETWAEAFAREPAGLKSHGLRQAESIAFSRDGKVMRVVSEGAKSPVARYQETAKE